MPILSTNKKLGEILLSLVYPPVCGICGKLNDNFLCRKCEIILEKQAVFQIQSKFDENKNFEEFMYLFKYEGIARKLILDYKFNDKSYLYKTFVNFLLKNQKTFDFLKSYDTIVPVPISKKRKKERGYNQSLLIAKEISKLLKINMNDKCLYKIRNIVPQSTLSKFDRKENIKDVYMIKNKEKLYNRKVLLIDDIYTTGSTVNECCRIIKKSEPEKIGILTIAKD